MDEGKVSALIEMIYNSAFEEKGWDHLLQSLRTQFHASQIVVSAWNWTGAPFFTGSTVADPSANQRFIEYYHTVDPTFPALQNNIHKINSMRVFPQEMIVERSVFLKSELYCDFTNAYDMGQSQYALIENTQHTFATFATHRQPEAPGFGAAEYKLLRALTPHLGRGLRLYLELGELRGKAGLFDTAFDQLAASFLLDASGRVLGLNQKAQALLADGAAPLTVTDRRLTARHASDAAKLTAALAPPSPGAPPPELVLRGLYGSLRISVTPVNGGDIPLFFDVTRKARAAFLVTARPLGPSLQNLMALHGLTRAEAEVTLLLSEGLRAPQIAAHRETSIATVNTQLKQIYAKTGVDGQIALILKLLGRR